MNLKDILQERIDKVGLKNISRHLTSKNNVELLKEVKEYTNFLGKTDKLTENIYCIMYDIKEKKKCKTCKEKPVVFKGRDKGYREYCCVSCAKKNDEVKRKCEITSLKNYGVKNPNQSDIIKSKKLKTIKTNYNVNSFSELYYKEEVMKKREHTCIEKYGVKSPLQSKSLQEKIRNRINDKYNTPNGFINSEIFNKKRDSTLKKKYGTDNLSEVLKSEEVFTKKIKTLKENYGVDNFSDLYNLPSVKEKRENTLKKKYGTDNLSEVLKSEEIFTKKIKTLKENYGVDNFSDLYNLPSVKEKREKTSKERYNNKNAGNIKKLENSLKKYKSFEKKHDLIIKLNYKNLDFSYTCNKCGNQEHNISGEDIYNRLIRYNITVCKNCHPISSQQSFIEKVFAEFITKIYNGDIETSNRKILNGKEIDIVLKDAKIGIEINGLYWHTDIQQKDKNYHYEKTLLAKDKGIQLFHIFTDEITQGMGLIYSILSNKGLLKDNLDIESINNTFGLTLNPIKKYFARNLNIVKVDTKEKRKYKAVLDEYHLQGSDKAKYYYALEDDNKKILSIMTFKAMSVDKNQISSNNQDKTFELSRYVTIPGVQIIGGFNKLLEAFRKDIIKDFPDINIELITYSNLRYSDEENNVYKRNGFINNGFTGINYYWFYRGKRYHRFKFRKDQLYNKYLPEAGIPVDKDYKKESERGMTERMIKHGISLNKIYDCGHIKWSMKLI